MSGEAMSSVRNEEVARNVIKTFRKERFSLRKWPDVVKFVILLLSGKP